MILSFIKNAANIYNVSVHVSLIQDSPTDSDEFSSDSVSGETAYAAGRNFPALFPDGKGA